MPVSTPLWRTVQVLLAVSSFARVVEAANTNITVSIPFRVPSDAPTLSPSLLSFSIEQDRWTEWVGSNTRNNFFYNTLDNLVRLSGEPPVIRIGANSQDHTEFNPNVEFQQLVFPEPTTNVPYPEARNITVGDGYYRSARFLPSNTHVIWGLNLGANNLTSAYLSARSLLKAFTSPEFVASNIKLDAISIGNEPDLFRNNGLRASSYSVPQYIEEWTAIAANVSEAMQLGSGRLRDTRIMGASFASSTNSLNGFSAQAILANGYLDSKAGKLVTSISQHRYSGSFCQGNSGLLQDLMTKSGIRGNLTVFKPDIAAVHARGLDYIMGETNSYACHGAPGVSNSAGAALWTLDYLLFAPQVGISKVYFHQGIGYKYNLIQPATLTRSPNDGATLPEPLPPHVQPQYYAAVIAAEAIGKGGPTRAVELSIPHPRLAGYAFYSPSGALVRALFINSQAYFASSTGPRGSIHIDLEPLNNSGTGARKVTVKRLAIGHADDLSGLKWAGQTYETPDGRPSGKVETETVSFKDGVDISDTEAVLLSFSFF